MKDIVKTKRKRVILDESNPSKLIKMIEEQTRDNIITDYSANINNDGSVPRGLVSELARKYGYSAGGITRMLERSGYLTKNLNTANI